MGMIKLPSEITYFETYLTLRCNFHCDYCINGYTEVKRKRDELPAKEMADALNRIDFQIPLTIGGGEPTIRGDFYDFISYLRPEINIDLLTNLQFDPTVFIKNIPVSRFTITKDPAYKAIRISYHPTMSNPQELIDKAEYLQEHGYNVGIFGIAHPLNIGDNIAMAEKTRLKKLYFFIKEFLGTYDDVYFGHYKYPLAIRGGNSNVLCRSNEVLIAPCGAHYKCHRDLYQEQYRLDNIIDPNFKVEYNHFSCNNFGECNPCDIKMKINRNLKDGRCCMDIKALKPE
jgi:MoaA/NifB/PqqE/SkfB family radical SAM enzyme